MIRDRAGAPVRLEDVAPSRMASRTYAAQPVNGVPAGTRYQEAAWPNAVSVARGIRATLDDIRRTLPAEWISGSASTRRRSSRNQSGISGTAARGALRLRVLALPRLTVDTLNVVLPFPCRSLGRSGDLFPRLPLNTFTLLALSLCVGIVVDDMVLENIFPARQRRQECARHARPQGIRSQRSRRRSPWSIFLPVVFMQNWSGSSSCSSA